MGIQNGTPNGPLPETGKLEKHLFLLHFRAPGLPKRVSMLGPLLGPALYFLKGFLKQIRVFESGEILPESGE